MAESNQMRKLYDLFDEVELEVLRTMHLRKVPIRTLGDQSSNEEYEARRAEIRNQVLARRCR